MPRSRGQEALAALKKQKKSKRRYDSKSESGKTSSEPLAPSGKTSSDSLEVQQPLHTDDHVKHCANLEIAVSSRADDDFRDVSHYLAFIYRLESILHNLRNTGQTPYAHVIEDAYMSMDSEENFDWKSFCTVLAMFPSMYACSWESQDTSRGSSSSSGSGKGIERVVTMKQAQNGNKSAHQILEDRKKNFQDTIVDELKKLSVNDGRKTSPSELMHAWRYQDPPVAMMSKRRRLTVAEALGKHLETDTQQIHTVTPTADATATSFSMKAIRERARQRGEGAVAVQAEIAAQTAKMKNKDRLLSLPRLCDTIRTKSLGARKYTWDLKETIAKIALEMTIPKAELLERIQILVSLVPEFICINQFKSGKNPATLQLRPTVPYGDIRKKLVAAANADN